MGVILKVLSSGPVEPGLNLIGPEYQAKTGHRLDIVYNSGSDGRRRMDAGEIFDVVIGTSVTIEKNFRPFGRIEDGGLNIGRVGLGMMVRSGVTPPDISTVDAFRQAALDADTVLYTDETSGKIMEDIFSEVGILDQLGHKTSLHHNGPAIMDRVLAGQGTEIGFLPITAIDTYRDKGIVLVGPLPEAVQYYLDYIAVPASRSIQKDIAWDFVHYCAGPGLHHFAETGLG